jgi:2OG-Fe(II) oxygenase superfamily
MSLGNFTKQMNPPVAIQSPASETVAESPHPQPFAWTTFDVRSMLPGGWDAEILDVANTAARERVLRPTSVTSREHDPALRLPTLTVGGTDVRALLPWLAALYEGPFCDLAQRCVDLPVTTARDPRYGVVINVKHGTKMRYECHVDSNPLEGLLYVTTHPPGAGGELLVSNRGDVPSCEEVDADCSTIHPVSGHLIFFDASAHSHYVRPLVDDADTRVVVAMNFYTPALPEDARPADLTRHLFGED